MQNYFTLFDLAPTFDLDLIDLEKRYIIVQRTCHPDRLIGKPAAERQLAILRSMQANEAFDALKHPLTRARHMLQLQGIKVGGEQDTVKPSAALLMEIMEWREQIEEAETLDALQKMQTQSAERTEVLLSKLSETLRAQDFQAATQLTIALGYYLKIQDEIRVRALAHK